MHEHHVEPDDGPEPSSGTTLPPDWPEHEILAEAEAIAHVGAWAWHITTGGLWWSDEVYRIFGRAPQEFPATYEAFVSYLHPDDRDMVTASVDAAVTDGAQYDIEHRVVRPDGSLRYVHERGRVTRDTDGVPVRMLGVVHDITERRHFEDELGRLAITDPLTGLFNRRHGQQILADEVKAFRRYGSPACLVLADIDHFKAVNDSLGHEMGDQVLVEVGRRLTANLRETDALVRWGGEEFVIVLRHCRLAEALHLTGQLRSIIADEPYDGSGRITLSAGVAELEQADDVTAWLARADAAMYEAKTAGRNTVRPAADHRA